MGVGTRPPQSNLGRACCFHTTMQQSPHWLQWDAPHLPQNCPFPFNNNYTSNTPIPQPTPLTSQTASRSSQPLCHSTLSRQTHTQTDRCLGDRSTPIALMLYHIDRERHAN